MLRRSWKIFILIVGMRYGSIVNGKSKSFVEVEYEEAKRLNIPIFAYVIDEAHPFPIEYVDRNANAKRLDEFKKNIQNDFTVEKFTTADDLADKVVKDLIRELPKKGYPINEKSKKLPDIAVGVKDIITFFKTLPKIYYGKEFSIDVQLEGFRRASKSECEALSLTYGASVRRTFIPKDKEIKDIIGKDLSAIYAQYVLAERLIKYGMYADVNIKVRTTQGITRTKTPIYRESRSPYMLGYGNNMFISGYETTEELIIGLELVEIR